MITSQNKKSQALLLIFLAWLTYMVSYFGKVNYSANITQIIDFYGVTKVQAGTAPTFFFFAYGVGQVVNGLLCKKYNIKWMVFGSLTVSAIINLIIAVTTDFAIIKWLWLINGISMSVLWPTLIRMLAESLPQASLGKSSVIMGTTVALGTLIIYGLSSVYAAISQFKLAFYTAAFSMAAVSAVWLCLYNKATMAAKAVRADEVTAQSAKAKVEQTQQKSDSRKLFLATVGTLCFCAVGGNLIKDGLTTWVPSILKEEFGMPDALSILLTLFLPILAVFANAIALKIHNKIPDYVNQTTVTFTLIAVVIGLILISLKLKFVVVMLVSLIAANFLASTINSLLTSIFPMFMRGKVNSGMIAGVINGFCYLGSTISSYGLGAIADHFGWNAVFWTLLGFCGLVCIVWLAYAVLKQYTKKTAKVQSKPCA